MNHFSQVSLPLRDPLAFLNASLLFAIQLLLALRPELLFEPDELSESYLLRNYSPERRLFIAIRELHYAIDNYHIAHSQSSKASDHRADDDIPF